MRLYEKYRPQRLDDVIGQPPVTLLKYLMNDPHSCCILIEGPPGCGKTSAAFALANELGVVDEFSGLFVLNSSDLTIDRCRQLFERDLRLRPMMGSGWRVVVMEELDGVPSAAVSRYLKEALEKSLPSRVIVVATSNDASALGEALLERFRVYYFSGGPAFASACREKLAAAWEVESGGEALPAGWLEWGKRRERFSLRAAWDDMQTALAFTRKGVLA